MLSAAEEVWIAVYTKSRCEVAVALQLQERGIETFVPLQRRLRQWSDRKQWVESPLIPSYVFVRILPRQSERIFEAKGVVRAVMFHGRIAVVRPAEIELLRRAVGRPNVKVEATVRFHAEEEVMISSGPFQGYRGIVTRDCAIETVAIRIEEIGMSLVVEMSAADVVPAPLEETL